MLLRAQRLQAEKDISAVLAARQGVFDAACGVRYARAHHGSARIAFSVGKKVSALAVMRNHIRRQFRALFLETLDQWPVGYDYVLLIGPEAKNLSYEEKRKRLARVLAKVRARLA
jgi:ribonuclease P protein component